MSSDDDDDILIRWGTKFKFYGIYVRGWYLLVGLPLIGFILGKIL